MKLNSLRRFSRLALFLVALNLVLPSFSNAADPPFRVAKYFGFTTDDKGKKPEMCQDEAIENLAKNLDWLEHQLNLFGTVVAKTPDVWGEARLTSHRQEFEDVLKQELNNFNKNQINGAEFVSDQSFLAFALAIKGRTTGNDANGKPIVVPPPITTNVNSTSTTEGGKTTTTGGAEPSIVLNVDASQRLNPFGITPDKLAIGSSIALEQTEMLDQLARYVNHLHQLRRINEGDDTSDSPGYSMNLVRIPVSLLPGQHTKKGYGAEITVTAEPYHGPELLPMAFKDFVINDLVDQLSIPMTRFLNHDPKFVADRLHEFTEYEQAMKELIEVVPELNTLLESQAVIFDKPVKLSCPSEFIKVDSKATRFAGKRLRDPEQAEGYQDAQRFNEEWIAFINSAASYAIQQKDNPLQLLDSQRKTLADYGNKHYSSKDLAKGGDLTAWNDRATEYTKSQELILSSGGANSQVRSTIPKKIKSIAALLGNALQKSILVTTINLPASTTRRSSLPFPPTQLISNFGLHELAHVTKNAYDAFQADIINREVIHVSDVQAYLREELGAAYELMSSSDMQTWWQTASNGSPDLVRFVRMRKTAELDQLRVNFIRSFTRHDGDQATAALAWCIYVESLLLNERLNQDVKETFGNKPGNTACREWIPYFGPNPPAEARQAFNEYVKIRWPIKVFALDPAVSEQNIADVRSIYRQMQMAIALAFANGDVGTSAALQTMRKLQRDRATVDLNRTAVGFGHGDDTFGWRFTPRFQTPPVESNVKVLFRDLVIGGPTDRQLDRAPEIEPGMRECAAIVVMPSFVPHVTFTTRGNWFKLGCRSTTANSITETVQFSRAIKQMETNAHQCVQCAHLYRDGEVERLLKRVKQMDRRLPLQTLECQVPIENSHGGFEVFSTGTRELAPELNGWYGAPGYDSSRGCKIFLSGDNFNVTTTRLIVGNQEIPVRLLSKQIMEVTLPPGLAAMRDRKLDEAERELYEGYVDAHVATPYGVSGHMLIPVVRSSNRAIARPTLLPNQLRLEAIYKRDNLNADYTVRSINLPPSLNFFRIDVPTNVGFDSKQTIDLITSTNSGNDRLANIPISALPRTSDGRGFEFTATIIKTHFQDISTANVLGSSFAHHLNYLLKKQPATGSANYRLKAAIKDGADTSFPIEGYLDIEIVLIKDGT